MFSIRVICCHITLGTWLQILIETGLGSKGQISYGTRIAGIFTSSFMGDNYAETQRFEPCPKIRYTYYLY